MVSCFVIEAHGSHKTYDLGVWGWGDVRTNNLLISED